MKRGLGLVPSVVFLFFAALSSCVYLLDVYPASILLWQINIDVLSKFRAAYYVLEVVISSSPLVISATVAVLAVLTARAALLRKPSQLFLLNHLAVILLGISLFSHSPASLVSADATLIGMGAGIPLPRLGWEHAINLALLLASLASCAGCHLTFLRRSRITQAPWPDSKLSLPGSRGEIAAR
jgi:hypothetical protein